MKPLEFLLSLAYATLSSASVLAAELPDGVYHSFADQHGVEYHTRLTHDGMPRISWTHEPSGQILNTSLPWGAEPVRLPESYQKRDCNPITEADDIQCGCGFTVVPASCDAAVADLKAQGVSKRITAISTCSSTNA